MPDFKDNSDELYRGDDEQPQIDEALAALQAERDQLFERLQRVSADYANAIKRHQQQLGDQVELAKGDLLKSFIPVLDHFDNALATPPASDEAKALHDGLAIVRNELLKVMQQTGVEQMPVQVGEPFDPTKHEAVFPQAAEGVQPHHVSLVLQSGYTFGKRALRAAKVAVAPQTPATQNEE